MSTNEDQKIETSHIDTILDQRGKDYGLFMDHATAAQNFKWLLKQELTKRRKALSPDQQESLEMIFHKIGRIVNGNPDIADHWDDIAGYAKLVGDRLRGKER